MNIQLLTVKGLYGYIDKEINFLKDITLLVGINGSGKTSILNIISWMIKPSIPHLCITEFEKIELTCSISNKNYVISCQQKNKKLTYELTTDGVAYTPLTVQLFLSPQKITRDENLRNEALSRYYSLIPEKSEQDTWNFIRNNIPSPTIIGLDRNLFTEEADSIYIDEATRSRIVRKPPALNISPLIRVKEIVNSEYRKKKNDILNLTNRLKNQLILSSFEGSISRESFNTGIRYKLKLAQISSVEKRVKDYFQQYEQPTFSDEDQKVIEKYFQQLKTITKQYQDNPTSDEVKLLFGLNASQFVKINKLLKEFNKFEKDSNKILEKIKLYLDTINFFFQDSSKKLVFKEDTGEISFNTFDKGGNLLNKFKDIKYLSSGEQQILILFSYLAFNSGDGKLFIIDEPELSLHLKWQEEFIHYLEIITPKTTQVILATHSPILVGKKKENTVLLYPYNN